MGSSTSGRTWKWFVSGSGWRLPKAFEGFHIVQLSDIHIGPFTTADYFRRCVAITNRLEPDLIALTGDYILWDPEAQEEVVRVLAGLRAPHGVFG
jgi:predicted MPP superfamily phosphohydrolase